MERDRLFRAVAVLGHDALEEEKDYEVHKRSLYLSDSTEALLYFLRRMFYRGRFDWLSEVYAEAAAEKVKHFIERTGWQRLDSKDIRLGEEQDPIGLKTLNPKGYKFPKADTMMVYDALKMISLFPKNNVIWHAKECIEEEKASDMYKKITSVRYVKDKLACLFLRDVASLYDLIETVGEDEVEYFLPVDTWVKQFCKKLQVLGRHKGDNRTVKKAIITECLQLDPPVQPIHFDHGLWVLSQILYAVKNLQLIERSINSLRIIRDSGIL